MGPRLVLNVSLQGAVHASGRIVQSAEVPTCSAFAAGARRDHVFTIPSGPTTAQIGGNPFALEAFIVRYAGPGRYPASAFGDPTTTTLTVDVSSATDPFEPLGKDAHLAATVDADGSGRFTFDRWQDPATRVESGVVSWTCSDAAT
jgi:hypothetical protein